jgi:hypothetical protein
MADPRAIGAVSATLRRLLEQRMELPAGVANFQVTVGRPISEPSQDLEPPRVNLFLYKVRENGGLKELDPGAPRGVPGTPPLWLDLSYLVTAFGTHKQGDDFQNESLAHELLGSAMRVLNDHAEIARNDDLLDETLRGEPEILRITLEPLELDDLSKIWMALAQPLRASAAYSIQALTIDSTRRRRVAPPVRQRRIHLAQLRSPSVERVFRRPEPGEREGDVRSSVGEFLRIEGERFQARGTFVVFEGHEPIEVQPVSPSRIEIAVPDAEPLQPGPHGLKVIARREVEVVQDDAERPHGAVVSGERTFASTSAYFTVVPNVGLARLASGPGEPAVLAVEGSRLFVAGLPTVVLIGDVALPVRAPTEAGGWDEPTSTRIEVPLGDIESRLAPGRYPVRVVVNGVTSRDNDVTFEVGA